mgnify:FL=1
MIIITGASKGIGKYLCDEYLIRNENVIGLFNSTIINNANNVFYKVNITDINEVHEFAAITKNKLSKITLINCAGINYNSVAHKSDVTKWREVIEVNVMGTFNMINTLLPIMREQNYGRIINFGSVVSELPTPGISAYAASKSALFGMTKSISVENASKGITINNINLGYSELGMISEVPDNYLSEIKQKIPSNVKCLSRFIINCLKQIK